MFDSRLPFPDRLDVDPSDGGDSGASTPPLWPTSPPDTPSGRGHVLSPASRTQAILQGQRELMKMMRNMPESCYDLSLKDLVELPRPPPHLIPDEEKRPSLDEYYRMRGQGYENRTTTSMMMGRSGSMGKGQQQQDGLLLKMVFPVHTGVGGARGRRKQRKERSEEDCSKACWRKQGPDSESGDSPSSSTMGGGSGKSSGSGSGSSCGSRRRNNAIRHERHVEEVCCFFLRRKPRR